MSIETTMTRAWQRQAIWLWLLLPVSWLYGFITVLRRQAYKIGLFASYRAPISVMVIGNITVGGSGKTPLIIALVNHLQNLVAKIQLFRLLTHSRFGLLTLFNVNAEHHACQCEQHHA